MFRRPDNTNSLSARTRFPLSSRKFKEKNILSAVLGTATIVVLCSSLVEPVWFTLTGGRCCHHYIGVNAFFGKMSMSAVNANDEVECKLTTNEGLLFCIFFTITVWYVTLLLLTHNQGGMCVVAMKSLKVVMLGKNDILKKMSVSLIISAT